MNWPAQPMVLVVALSTGAPSVPEEPLAVLEAGHEGAIWEHPPWLLELLERPVDINDAAREVLASLPGMTAALADSLMAGRPYAHMAAFMAAKVLPAAVAEEIQPYIRVGTERGHWAAHLGTLWLGSSSAGYITTRQEAADGAWRGTAALGTASHETHHLYGANLQGSHGPLEWAVGRFSVGFGERLVFDAGLERPAPQIQSFALREEADMAGLRLTPGLWGAALSLNGTTPGPGATLFAGQWSSRRLNNAWIAGAHGNYSWSRRAALALTAYGSLSRGPPTGAAGLELRFALGSINVAGEIGHDLVGGYGAIARLAGAFSPLADWELTLTNFSPHYLNAFCHGSGLSRTCRNAYEGRLTWRQSGSVWQHRLTFGVATAADAPAAPRFHGRGQWRWHFGRQDRLESVAQMERRFFRGRQTRPMGASLALVTSRFRPLELAGLCAWRHTLGIKEASPSSVWRAALRVRGRLPGEVTVGLSSSVVNAAAFGQGHLRVFADVVQSIAPGWRWGLRLGAMRDATWQMRGKVWVQLHG